MNQAAQAPCTTGGCLCGSVQYRINAPLVDIAHCHCGMCRKSSGGIVTTWVTVLLDAFSWSGAKPRSFASSGHADRYFCDECGVLLALSTRLAPTTIDVTVATADQADAYPANRHAWFNDHLPWLHLDEALPHEARETI